MNVGKRIQTYRKQAGLTQKQLAENIGIAPGTIQQYELGKRQPRLEQLERIAESLNVRVSDITGESDISHAQNSPDNAHVYNTRINAGHNLKRLREEMGLNQTEFANATGISKAVLSSYENGYRSPDIDFINLVKKKTGCSANFLLGHTSVMREAPIDFESQFHLSSEEADELLKLSADPFFRFFLQGKELSYIFKKIRERSFEAAVDPYDRKALVWDCIDDLTYAINGIVEYIIEQLREDPNADELLFVLGVRRDEAFAMRKKYLEISANSENNDPFVTLKKQLTQTEE